MSRIPAEIAAFRRTVLTGTAARAALVLAFVAGLSMVSLRVGNALFGAALLAAAGVAYLALTWRSLQISREALVAPEHIARGDYAAAEQLLTRTIRRFSLYPAQRVVELHHMAVLRHEQGRFAEAAELAGAVLQRRSPLPVEIASRIVRLESLLEIRDLHGAHGMLDALTRLSATGQLNLPDVVRLMAGRIRYEAMVGAWSHLLHGLPAKLPLIDLMPPRQYAVSHLLLAVAARRLRRDELGRWLVGRALSVAPDAAAGWDVPDLSEWIRAEQAP